MQTLRSAAEASLIRSAIVIVGRRDAGYLFWGGAGGGGAGGDGAVGHGGSDVRPDWVQ